ncbi:MAG: hypothetical protein QOC82_442 [Frankiaceae bacterium]|nr:hypothetical protein [Frankiaceae bacterium]
MRLLLDEMISPRVAEALRTAGHDVVAVAEDPALRASPDDALLEQAAADNRTLVTCNVADFARLHAEWHTQGRRHHGLVMVTLRAFPQNRSFVGALVAALLGNPEVLELARQGACVFLHPSTQEQ